VLCKDDPVIRDLLPEVSRPILTYGVVSDADVRASDVRQVGTTMVFHVSDREGRLDVEVTLNLPGMHNVLNALAAIAVAVELGVADDAVCRALVHFEGIGRRFQVCGDLSIAGGHVLLVDDYAHHPREIAATLDAVRASWPERRLVVVYQPHRYTRTRDLFEDFAQVLCEVDMLLMFEIYPAGEAPIVGADGRTLCRAIRARGKVDPVFVETLDALPGVLPDVLRDGDVLLVLGAGDIGTVPAMLMERARDADREPLR